MRFIGQSASIATAPAPQGEWGMTLLLVAAILLGLAGLPQVAGFAALIPPFHMYRQLKGTYGLSRANALLRTVLLVGFSTIALGLFGIVLVVLGLFD